MITTETQKAMVDNVYFLIPSARELVRTIGVASAANDSDDAGKAFAHANWEQLHNGFCACETPGDEVYYRNHETGSHGWMCSTCRGVTQTG